MATGCLRPSPESVQPAAPRAYSYCRVSTDQRRDSGNQPRRAAVAALLKAQDPNRDWRAIKNRILAGGDEDPRSATFSSTPLPENGQMRTVR
jgi:hypothetical protein